MPKFAQERSVAKPAGYQWLLERFSLQAVPNWHRSSVTTSSGIHRIGSAEGVVDEAYPAKYWPGERVGDQLEFAIKYDGTNLAILATLFSALNVNDFLAYIQSKPTGKYARRLWFLYEFLTGTRLPLEDIERGNYIDLLDPNEYYTTTPGRPIRRQRINDNLLGDAGFCPTVRRTEPLGRFEEADPSWRCREVVSRYSPDMLKRAMSYLFTKETKASFAIEHIKPSSTRIERFVAMLHMAQREDFCEKSMLTELQNRFVDPRFQATDYRSDQNYVGETVTWQSEKIHFVSPKPEDLPGLMAGLVSAHRRMKEGNVAAVVHAAAVAYGFVFLHPFDDGNGRIHRFLIHNVLAGSGFTPDGAIFPVSASMLKDIAAYDASLEAFSKPLMTLVDYSLDEEGRMTVANDTARWYRYIDMTPQAEALADFIERTIDTELVAELNFLVNYDRTKSAIQEIVDMPDRQIDLFIRVCLQNSGCLSARKRAASFAFLSDEEVQRLELAVQSGYGKVPAAEL